jgi:hypothetical protein
MNKFASLAKKALSFGVRAIAAGVLPAIATYYWTSSNHYNYWNRTIFAVQTIDFKILAHTLPTKLSALIIKNDAEEIQRTLQSNTGRFGMIVTNCKVTDKECPNQTVLYRTQSRSSWSRNFSIEDLRDAPFDILRDPPPLKAEIDFKELRTKDYITTGQTNTGQIIGRVYYVRGIAPSYWDSWLTWFRDPLIGVGSIYTPSVTTFFASWLVLILLLEIAINKIEAKKQQNRQLDRELNEVKEKNTAILKDKSRVLVDLRKAEEEQQTLLDYLQQTVNDTETLQASLEVAKAANSQLQIELQQTLDESTQNLTSYERELKVNTEYIDDLEKTITYRKEHLVPQAEIDEYQQKLYEANSNQDRLHQLIESQSQDIRLKQQESQILNEEKIDLETQLGDVGSELSNSKRKVATLESDKKSLEDSIIKIKADKTEAESKAKELDENLERLSHDKKNSEANLQLLLEQARNDSDLLAQIYDHDLKDKDSALATIKESHENHTKDLEQKITQLKSKIQDIECDLISARSDRDYFIALRPEVAEIPLVDISSLYIGFVGGRLKTMNRVINSLQKDHGLINFVLIPAEKEYDYKQDIFREKLKNCHLIAVITRKVGHPYSNMVDNLRSKGAITDDVLFINFNGESGIVREFINYAKNLDKSDAA